MTPALVEIISAVATVVAIAGVVLNNYRLRWCFLLWLLSNALSAGIHLHAGLWTLCGRDLVFLLLAVHGWMAWRRSKP